MNLLSQMKIQSSLPTILECAAGKSIEDQAMAAEIYFAKFVAEHNLPFLIADHFSPLPKLCSQTAKLPRCTPVQAKTAAIITHALAPVMSY